MAKAIRVVRICFLIGFMYFMFVNFIFVFSLFVVFFVSVVETQCIASLRFGLRALPYRPEINQVNLLLVFVFSGNAL